MTATPAQPQEYLVPAASFPPADREQWRELVAASLRKSGLISEDATADVVEQVLSTTTYDGVRVLPLYTADDLPPDYADQAPADAPADGPDGARPAGWDVRQRHAHPDPQVSQAAVQADLENGVSSLWLVLGPGALPLGSLDLVLRDVYLDLVPVVLDAAAATVVAADEFLALITARPGLAVEKVRGNLGADPIGQLARGGEHVCGAGLEQNAGPGADARTGEGADAATPGDLSVLAMLARRCRETSPGLRAITVDGTIHHDAGGSDADELGASLATGVAYLRALTDAGLDVDEAFGQLDFRYAAGPDQFLTIAKFRAARRLWARVAQVCGVQSTTTQRQHAVTSSAMMTRRDPWVNLLRTTLACFGAGVGGAGAITVQPFDAALGLPDAFARRIARNTSSLLVMESHLARVLDPAAGSWYVERLTSDLAEAAWAWFTRIEQAGGMLAALESGLLAQRLEQTWRARAANLARRRDLLTGVSEFPNLTESPVVRTPFPDADPPADSGAGAGAGAGVRGAGTSALPRHRYAEVYEQLRDDADAATARCGTRPAVFLATIGSASASTARAGFAANLFQAGGLATPDSGVGTDPAVIAAAFTESGARVACLASSDKVYAEHVAPVTLALKEAGAEHVWLAGKPGRRAQEDVAAGIDGYLYTGVDVVALLRTVHEQTGIRR